MPQEVFRLARLFTTVAGFAVLAACGGGGGGGDGGLGNNPPGNNPGGNDPAPTVTLSSSATAIASGQTVTLTWNTANASSCTASGGWTGSKATSGTETTTALTATTSYILTCTGAGGSNSATANVRVIGAPTVTLTAAQTALTANYSTTLSWSATDATSCTASNTGGGEFTGARPATGTDATGPVAAGTSTYALSCTGAGGTASASVEVTASAPAAGQVVLFGQVTFDRLPFRSVAQTGLNGSQPIVSPVREAVVQFSGGIPATTTDAGGYYAVTVPAGTSVQVSVPVQMLKTGTAPTWNFRVLNNANNDIPYVLQGSDTVVDPTLPRNLHASSGWGTTSYTGPRNAAPFAILDTVYQAKQLILTANPTANFPDLALYWSTENRTANDPFCPDDGNIGTSFYFRDPSGVTTDDCSPAAPLPPGIYVLGDYANGNGDTDEFDAHVIAHEFGHYFEDQFSRSDSIGGEHTAGDRLDPRVAFGEGWGNAFGAMSLGDPLYRDSSVGISRDFDFNLDSDSDDNEGWFSESSVGELLWDFFDSDATAESGDTLALGFAPLYAVMTGPQVETDALTSIFSFASALRSQNSGVAGAISTMLNRESINGSDAFGSGETNNGGDTRALPVYDTITLNTPKNNVCSSSVAGNSDGNKLGNHRFLRFDNGASRVVTIRVQGAATNANTTAATDPDVLVFRRGSVVLAGESAEAGVETISQQTLPAGTYILDVYDFDIFDAGQSLPSCMTVTISGN